MTRLDIVILRLQAQRACLNACPAMIADIPGPVLELGLGNGRTYDHLRSLFPDRDIFVFDRHVASHPDSTPDAAHTILGDFRDTVPFALSRIGQPAALAHADFGSANAEATAAMAAWLSETLPPLLVPGAVLATDQRLEAAALTPIALPDELAPGRYHMYRAHTGAA